MNYDSVIFDLDGTLWDSTAGVRESWGKVLLQQPDIPALPSEEALAGVMGLSSDKLMKKLYPHLSYARGQEIFDLCCQEENRHLLAHGGVLYAGIEEMLTDLSAKVPLFIVSNCNSGYIETFLQAHHMRSYFQDWECFGNTRREKAENIQLVVARNHLESPVYVGDTAWDCEAAAKAGIPFIHAAYGFGGRLNAPSITAAAELPALLRTGYACGLCSK